MVLDQLRLRADLSQMDRLVGQFKECIGPIVRLCCTGKAIAPLRGKLMVDFDVADWAML